MRTPEGYSQYVQRGQRPCSRCWVSWGCTRLLAILFLFLVLRTIAHGPVEKAGSGHRLGGAGDDGLRENMTCC